MECFHVDPPPKEDVSHEGIFISELALPSSIPVNVELFSYKQ